MGKCLIFRVDWAILGLRRKSISCQNCKDDEVMKGMQSGEARLDQVLLTGPTSWFVRLLALQSARETGGNG